jgi:DNA-binding transcriptional MocR family regulator
MTTSQIRALFAVASRPEVVSLAGGMPNLSVLPLDAVAATVQHLVKEHSAVALQYGSGQGDPQLRERICEVMALEGIAAPAQDVVITVGSQQALDLVTRIFCDPGDVVLCEAPSYVGALGVFASYECEVVQVPMDEGGLVPAALAEALGRLAAAGRRAKFLYTIPNHHNPAGVSIPQSRRAELLDICTAADLLIVEDNPYGLLSFDAEPPPAIRAMDPKVIYLGSFSKTFAPGFRVGWALAPPDVRDALVLVQEAATLCPPTFGQHAISAYLAGQDWRAQIDALRDLYLERRDAMLDALRQELSGIATWTVPDGGFYIWLRLLAGVDTTAMLPRAIEQRVAYVPGAAFFAGGGGADCLRLSYCYPTPERIQEGVRRLARVIEAELDLAPAVRTPVALVRS